MQDIITEEDLDEMNIEIIRNTLYKAYLEDFLAFCNSLGGETAKIMTEILEVCRLSVLHLNFLVRS
jgi:V-type H+-transporting ATPase subunit d